jgi:hypothetical protein
VVDLLFERAVCEAGEEDLVEVSDAGDGEGCARAAVGGAKDGRVVEDGVGVEAEFAGGEYVEV